MPLSAEIMGLLARRRSVDWWLVGGIDPAIVRAAYQPVGAAALAASYINLANQGTYNAAPGTAPTWDVTGWTFDGATTYLKTGYTVPITGGFLVKFSGASQVLSSQWICGSYTTAGYGIGVNQAGVYGSRMVYYCNSFLLDTPSISSGVVGVINKVPWKNGAPVSTALTGGITPGEFWIGDISGIYRRYFSGKITSLVLFFSAPTDAQVAAISAAMP